MLLTSVIIVLREIVEAALLIATLLAATRFTRIGHSWLRISISSGLAGALLFAWQLRPISNLYDGLVYEISNALLQILIYAVILVLIALLLKLYLRSTTSKKPLLFLWGLPLA